MPSFKVISLLSLFLLLFLFPVLLKAQEEEDPGKQKIMALAENLMRHQNETTALLDSLKSEKSILEVSLQDAYNNSGFYTDEDIANYEQKLKEIKKTEKATLKKEKIQKDSLAFYQNLLNKSPEKREKFLAGLEPKPLETEKKEPEIAQNPDPVQIDTPSSKTSDILAASIPTGPEKKFREFSATDFAKPRPEDDVIFMPPPPECNVEFDGVDEFNGKKRKDLAPKLLFAQTDDLIRQQMKDREYITCNAVLTSISSGLYFLTLEFTIASTDAQKGFGMLEKGSIITIKLLNNKNVRLVSNKTDNGQVDLFKGVTVYRGQYPINDIDAKTLTSYECDKIRVNWSTGYEDYDINEVDFFINQFKCLNIK